MGVNIPSSTGDNYYDVSTRIAAAAQAAGRDPGDVSLIVVTKGHSIERVREAIQAGATRFGENYAEEGVEKITALKDQSGIEWHMIGHIQSRKAKLVTEYFNWIHSIDSFKLAARLDRFAKEQGRNLPVLLECNVSGEDSKYGFNAVLEDRWDELAREISPILQLPNLVVKGLMTMAPYASIPELSRRYFHLLRRLRDHLTTIYPASSWSVLSMGMSADYEVAVREGSTMVRIGEAILGPRSYQGG